MKPLLKKLRYKLNTGDNSKSVTNILWLIGDKIIRLGVGIYIIALTARYLGPVSFGLLNFAFAFVWIFENVVTVGLNEIILRDLVKDPAKQNQILGSAFLLKLVGSVSAFLLIAGIITLLRPGDQQIRNLVMLMSVSMIIKNAGVIRFWFEVQILSKYVVVAEITAFILAAVFRLILIHYKFPLIYFIWAFIVEALISSIMFIILYYHKSRSLKRWSVTLPLTRQMLKDSWLMIFTGLSVMLYLRCDQVLLKFIAGDKEAGIYNAAARLSEIWYFIPSSVIITMFPKILTHKSSDKVRYEAGLQKMFDYITIVCLCAAVMMTVFSKLLVGLIFGQEYIAAAPVLTIHIWGGTFLLLLVGSSKHMVAEGLQKLDLFRTIIGAFLNIGLNVLLIPRFGAIGSAWATIVSYCISVFSAGLFTRGKKMSWMMLNALNPVRLGKSYLSSLKQIKST